MLFDNGKEFLLTVEPDEFTMQMFDEKTEKQEQWSVHDITNIIKYSYEIKRDLPKNKVNFTGIYTETIPRNPPIYSENDAEARKNHTSPVPFEYINVKDYSEPVLVDSEPADIDEDIANAIEEAKNRKIDDRTIK